MRVDVIVIVVGSGRTGGCDHQRVYRRLTFPFLED